MPQLLEKNVLHVYSDGSSLSKPRRGGYAVRFVYLNDAYEEQVKDFEYPGVFDASNNQMELRGCIAAINEAPGFLNFSQIDEIVFFTDSEYVRKHLKEAIFNWPKTRWIGKNGPILNVDYWKELSKDYKRLAQAKQISVHRVAGHSGNPHNDAVDRLARNAAKNCITPHRQSKTVRKKPLKVAGKQAVVSISGQKFVIKIYTVTYINQHKCFHYKYQVVSIDHPDYKKTGLIFYKRALQTRFSYLVTLGSDSSDPYIKEVHEIIETSKEA